MDKNKGRFRLTPRDKYLLNDDEVKSRVMDSETDRDNAGILGPWGATRNVTIDDSGEKFPMTATLKSKIEPSNDDAKLPDDTLFSEDADSDPGKRPFKAKRDENQMEDFYERDDREHKWGPDMGTAVEYLGGSTVGKSKYGSDWRTDPEKGLPADMEICSICKKTPGYWDEVLEDYICGECEDERRGRAYTEEDRREDVSRSAKDRVNSKYGSEVI